MTEAVQGLLQTFDALTDAEKQEATVQLLRRAVEDESGDVPEDALVAAAEELFLELDAREAADGQSQQNGCGGSACCPVNNSLIASPGRNSPIHPPSFAMTKQRKVTEALATEKCSCTSSKKRGPRRTCDEGQVVSAENRNCPSLQALSGSVKQRPFRARLGSQTQREVTSDDKQPASQDGASTTLRSTNNYSRTASAGPKVLLGNATVETSEIGPSKLA